MLGSWTEPEQRPIAEEFPSGVNSAFGLPDERTSRNSLRYPCLFGIRII